MNKYGEYVWEVLWDTIQSVSSKLLNESSARNEMLYSDGVCSDIDPASVSVNPSSGLASSYRQ